MLKLLSLSVASLPVLAALLALLYGGACFYLYQQQQRMIFFPSVEMDETPMAYGVTYEDVWILVRHGAQSNAPAERIHGWWMPALSADANVLLYLHGNGENISANASKAAWFHRLGFSVLLIDYRGYGLSQGPFPSEQQVYADAQASLEYLVRDRHISMDQLYVFGHSLGGAIAIDLAIHHPDLAGLIVEGSFTSMLAMSNRTKNFGIFPIDRILTQRFDSLSKLSQLKIPSLFVHGTDDDVVPPDMSAALMAAAPDPKDLLLVPGAGHEDVVEFGAAEYQSAIQRLVEQASALSLHSSLYRAQ